MIAVLTSGVALGVHVPGLLLAARLREQGVPAEVYVLERLLPPERLDLVAQSKWAFHRDFRLARAGQRLAADPVGRIPDAAVEELFQSWRRQRVTRFVVFSGFWLTVLERYRAAAGEQPRIDLCHVDSVLSPSFRNADVGGPRVGRWWLADAEHGLLPWTIPVGPLPPLPWAERGRRVLVHGGGWGMGTYRRQAPQVAAAGLGVDLVVHDPADLTDPDGDPDTQQSDDTRYFAMDPSWHPWQDDGFPPFAEVPPDWRAGEAVAYTRNAEHHGSFPLARAALAVMSKPGGGTLLDSLWSGTPLVLLEPSGPHEARNAELWQSLGYGVPLAEWRGSGFDTGLLKEMHLRLLKGRDAPGDLPSALAAVCSRGADARL